MSYENGMKVFFYVIYIFFKTGTSSDPPALMSRKPAYFITNLSRAKERPETSNPLYSALHGPVGNNTWVRYEHILVNNCWRKRVPDQCSNEWLYQRENEEVLYLYHGSRWCVSRENDTRGRALFHWLEDASDYYYAHHLDHIELNQPLHSVHNKVRQLLETSERPALPTTTLFARNTTRGAGRGPENRNQFFM